MTSGKWSGSERKSRLPDDWERRRRVVRERSGGRCEKVIRTPVGFRRCPGRATDVDHIVPGDDHSFGNLRDLCANHHTAQSAREGVEARRKPPAKRPPERHPGDRR